MGAHPDCLCIPEFAAKFLYFKSCGPDQRKIAILNDWRFRLWGITDTIKKNNHEHFGQVPADDINLMVKTYGQVIANKSFKIWVDHTPENLWHIANLIKIYPEARFIHLIRDGRGVFASTKKLYWGPCTPLIAAQYWGMNVGLGLTAESLLGPEKVLRIYYEDLVRHTESTLTQICTFSDLSFYEGMLKANGFVLPDYTKTQHRLVGQSADASRAGSWQNELAPREIEIFESKAGAFLDYLGFETFYGNDAAPPSIVESTAQKLKDSLKYHFWTKAIRGFKSRLVK
jgi:hypothetical protein